MFFYITIGVLFTVVTVAMLLVVSSVKSRTSL